jgi:hypothetical protein
VCLAFIFFVRGVNRLMSTRTLDERRVHVDEVFDGKAAIDKVLHGFHAILGHVAPDAVAVVGHLVHHLAIGGAEHVVVLEKCACPQTCAMTIFWSMT